MTESRTKDNEIMNFIENWKWKKNSSNKLFEFIRYIRTVQSMEFGQQRSSFYKLVNFKHLTMSI